MCIDKPALTSRVLKNIIINHQNSNRNALGQCDGHPKLKRNSFLRCDGPFFSCWPFYFSCSANLLRTEKKEKVAWSVFFWCLSGHAEYLKHCVQVNRFVGVQSHAHCLYPGPNQKSSSEWWYSCVAQCEIIGHHHRQSLASQQLSRYTQSDVWVFFFALPSSTFGIVWDHGLTWNFSWHNIIFILVLIGKILHADMPMARNARCMTKAIYEVCEKRRSNLPQPGDMSCSVSSFGKSNSWQRTFKDYPKKVQGHQCLTGPHNSDMSVNHRFSNMTVVCPAKCFNIYWLPINCRE